MFGTINSKRMENSILKNHFALKEQSEELFNLFSIDPFEEKKLVDEFNAYAKENKVKLFLGFTLINHFKFTKEETIKLAEALELNLAYKQGSEFSHFLCEQDKIEKMFISPLRPFGFISTTKIHHLFSDMQLTVKHLENICDYDFETFFIYGYPKRFEYFLEHTKPDFNRKTLLIQNYDESLNFSVFYFCYCYFIHQHPEKAKFFYMVKNNFHINFDKLYHFYRQNDFSHKTP